MTTNTDIKGNPIKLPITEYSHKHNISVSTCRNWIRGGKVEWELVNGKYFIYDYELDINSAKSDINVDINESDRLYNLIESLTEQIEYLKKDIEDRNSQVTELLKQQNQYQQIIMSMNQNQKVLVESRRTWFQRLFGLNMESA